MPIQINSNDHFSQLLQENPRIIVDWYATWCPPCKAISPLYEELSEKNPEVTFLKVNVDEFAELAQKYKVTAMPTFHTFKDAKEFDKLVGANTEKLKGMVAKLKTA